MGDYLLETRLKEQSPDLHRRMKDTAAVLNRVLDSFLSWFPGFTDHSNLHSMDVLDFSNRLIGDQVGKLSAEECYVLIMACYLHDVGMGISKKDYDGFVRELGLESYCLDHPENSEADIVRIFHHEFSGAYIRKYAELFDIPSDELQYAIVQVSRGHRKTDLFDEKEYPDIRINDSLIRTSFLAAVLRLADEIDMGVDRNPEILFDSSALTKQVDIENFAIHESIRTVEVQEDSIVLNVKPKEPKYIGMIREVADKMQETLDYCRDVADKRSKLIIRQKRIVIKEAET